MKREKYFFNQEGDRRMEKQNLPNWVALTRLIHMEAHKCDPQGKTSLPDKDWNILDIGCHTGGLLEVLNNKRRATRIYGVEPILHARGIAKRRLPRGEFFQEISQIQRHSVDLVVSHETLYLVPNLNDWINQLKRVLRPDGGAFISLGSHSENTAWLRWRHRLTELYGHTSHVYSPMNILRAGENAGFEMELHQLHPEPQTSFRYSPPKDGWGEFLSAKEALDFQRQKYVFVFYPKR